MLFALFIIVLGRILNLMLHTLSCPEVGVLLSNSLPRSPVVSPPIVQIWCLNPGVVQGLCDHSANTEHKKPLPFCFYTIPQPT